MLFLNFSTWLSGALLSRLEPIPDPRLSHYVACLRGIRLDFLSQLSYKDPQVLRLFNCIAAPHCREQGAMREDAARVAHEVRYQIEFLGGQPDFLSANGHHVRV